MIPSNIVKQYALRPGDTVMATTGRDPRGRVVAVHVTTINAADPASLTRRPDFGSLTATYPERQLVLETGRPAKGGPELTRRAIDLIAPIGYGQRALIVAPARAGKTMLLPRHHGRNRAQSPNAKLLILLVDERPGSERGDLVGRRRGHRLQLRPGAERHVEVTEMVLEHSRRLVEMGKECRHRARLPHRMARAQHGGTWNGAHAVGRPGRDSDGQAKGLFRLGPFGRAQGRGGSLTIIATALVETGSRMTT